MDNRPYPKSGRRGCQCADGTYRINCCDGDSQGVGSLENQSVSIYNYVDGDTGTTVTTRGEKDLVCSDINITGFSVSDQGVITVPSINIGSISSTSPASFDTVSVDTIRTLTINITVPSGYSNEGDTIVCTTTATQPLEVLPTLECSDITISGFSVAYDGVITLPTIDIGTIASTSPSSFSDPETDTLRTLNVNITVPSGYSNTGDILACTTTATQPGNQPALTCDDLTFTGFAVDFKGAITTPSVDIGTVASISPTSFNGHVTTDTSRTITINVTVPSGYSNAGANLACTSATVTQAAVTEFWIRYTADNWGKAAGQALSVSQGCSLQTNNTLVNNKFIHLGSNNIPTMSDEVYIVNGRPGDGTCGYSGGGFGSYFIVHGFATNIGQAATVGEKISCQVGNAPAYLTEPSASYQSADFVLTTSTSSGVTAITECT